MQSHFTTGCVKAELVKVKPILKTLLAHNPVLRHKKPTA